MSIFEYTFPCVWRWVKLEQETKLQLAVQGLERRENLNAGSPENPNYASLEDLLSKMTTTPTNKPSCDKALRNAKSAKEAKRILIDT